MARRKIICTLTDDEKRVMKQKLLDHHQEHLAKKYPQYLRDSQRYRLGQMTRTWRKNGYNYAEAGDYILYYKTNRLPDFQGKVYNLTVYSSKRIEVTPTFIIEGERLVCQEHWVEDREPAAKLI